MGVVGVVVEGGKQISIAFVKDILELRVSEHPHPSIGAEVRKGCLGCYGGKPIVEHNMIVGDDGAGPWVEQQRDSA